MPSPSLFSFFSNSSPPTGETTPSSSSSSPPPSSSSTSPPPSSSSSSDFSPFLQQSQPSPCQAFHRFTSSVLPPSLHKIFERQCVSSSSSPPLLSTSSPSSSQSFSSFCPSSSSIPSAFSVVSSSSSSKTSSLPPEDCWQCRYTGVAVFSGVSTAALFRSYAAVKGSIDRKFFAAISTAFAFLAIYRGVVPVKKSSSSSSSSF